GGDGPRRNAEWRGSTTDTRQLRFPYREAPDTSERQFQNSACAGFLRLVFSHHVPSS
ncbi:hypothetical protein LTR16_005339, partial [Cryomyces antarcticus]